MPKKTKKKNPEGLTKKEERLGWITRGHEPQATSKQQAIDKRQASSYSRIIKEK